MGRGRKAGISTAELLEQQIEKAQEKVMKAKATYESAVDALQKILDKRDAHRKDTLWKAIATSDKSYEDILDYISEATDEE
jgi:ElaB/YqjD/DUF883 family membrane-anchored ribosome-binding protein